MSEFLQENIPSIVVMATQLPIMFMLHIFVFSRGYTESIRKRRASCNTQLSKDEEASLVGRAFRLGVISAFACTTAVYIVSIAIGIVF